MDAQVPITDSDKPVTFISELVQKHFQKYMQELERRSEKFVKREQLTDFINQFIDEKLHHCLNGQQQVPRKPAQPQPSKSPAAGDSKPDFVTELNENDTGSKQTYFKDDVALLEQRINNLEDCLDTLLHLRKPKTFKGNNKSDRYKFKSMTLKKPSVDFKPPYFEVATAPASELKINQNPYDDMYYEWRQNKLNRTHCKSVDETAQTINTRDFSVNCPQRCSLNLSQCIKPHQLLE